MVGFGVKVVSSGFLWPGFGAPVSLNDTNPIHHQARPPPLSLVFWGKRALVERTARRSPDGRLNGPPGYVLYNPKAQGPLALPGHGGKAFAAGLWEALTGKPL